MRLFAKLRALLLPLLIASCGAAAQPAEVRQRLGARIPLDAAFLDETGEALTLGALVGRAPALLLLGYFQCRKLCSPLRREVMNALVASGLTPGRDYTLLVVSVDPKETPRQALEAKEETLARFDLPGAGAGWRFLTSGADTGARIADAVGFDVLADPDNISFTHPVSVVVLTPGGSVSAYLSGFGLDPVAIRLALTKAAVGKISKPVAQAALLCFDFDPVTGRYSFAVIKLLRLFAGCFAVLGLAITSRALLCERRT